MLSFFRKIRQDLISKGKTSSYLKYAFGELFIIILGILFALNLQNWNEKRKHRARFEVTMEQIYNALNYDMELYLSQLERLKNQIRVLDSVIENPGTLQLEQLPYLLFAVTYEDYDNFQTETLYFTPALEFKDRNSDDNEIAKEVLRYVTNANHNINMDMDLQQDLLINYLLESGFAYPKIDLESINQGFNFQDSTYYASREIERLDSLTQTEPLRSLLKTYRSQKVMTHVSVNNRYNDAKSILNLIKLNYPEVEIVYQKVGIIGTSIAGYDDVGAISVPLEEMDKEKGIWQKEMFLKKGTVKFRCRDSWAQNWGGINFPHGQTLKNGPDIPVKEAGNYRIVLNLKKHRYSFIRI